MKAFGQSDPRIEDYVVRTFQPCDGVLAEIAERTRRAGMPEIQVGPMDGLHLEVLTRAAGARKAVEFGALGGYSGVCIARGLQPGGKLYALEIDARHADVAREAYALASVADRVEVLVGPALETMRSLESKGPFDLVFIDADKDNYPHYLRWAADHLRAGGLVIADNTFAWGRIADPAGDSARAIDQFNREAAMGGRFRSTILPTAEGLTVGVKVR